MSIMKKDAKKQKRIGYRVRKNPLKTKDVAPYIGEVVPVGTCGLEQIVKDVAANLGITVARSRMLFDALIEEITELLKAGNKVETPFGWMEPAISGSMPCEDSPFDPKRNSVYVKVTPPKAIRDALKKIVPERLDAPKLSIGTVVTASLGARAYNAVKRGEPFVLAGSGFEEGMAASLSDSKGVAHPLVIESVRPTALVCSFSAAVPKGAATLLVSVTDEETGRVRASASRKVKVV